MYRKGRTGQATTSTPPTLTRILIGNGDNPLNGLVISGTAARPRSEEVWVRILRSASVRVAERLVFKAWRSNNGYESYIKYNAKKWYTTVSMWLSYFGVDDPMEVSQIRMLARGIAVEPFFPCNFFLHRLRSFSGQLLVVRLPEWLTSTGLKICVTVHFFCRFSANVSTI